MPANTKVAMRAPVSGLGAPPPSEQLHPPVAEALGGCPPAPPAPDAVVVAVEAVADEDATGAVDEGDPPAPLVELEVLTADDDVDDVDDEELADEALDDEALALDDPTDVLDVVESGSLQTVAPGAPSH